MTTEWNRDATEVEEAAARLLERVRPAPATRTYKSDLLSTTTTLEIVARSETQRGVVLNGDPYWINKVGAATYTVVAAEEDGRKGTGVAESYTVAADDLGGRCTCKGCQFHRQHACKHLVCVAVLRRCVRSLAALAVKEVK